MTLVRVVSPRFVAGFVVEGDRVVRCAPILRKALMGRSTDDARRVIRTMGWLASIIRQDGPETGSTRQS